MSKLYLMTTIVRRPKLPEVLELYKEEKLEVNLIALGHGTATGDVASVLGLENSEKAVCFSFVTPETWKRVKKGLEGKIRIDVPGTGIVFTVPLSSIGGKRELAYLSAGQDFKRGEEEVMKETKRELLVIISNQGYNEQVMDAARSVGAAGGTIIHARGTGRESAEKFFGVSLASEKDITFIVTRTKQKNAIMQAVMEKAGVATPAGAIVFSLPVSETAGLKLIDSEEENEAQEAAEQA